MWRCSSLASPSLRLASRDALLRSCTPVLEYLYAADGVRLHSSGKKNPDLSHLIPEKDLYEDFVFGSGPGGQAVNKTKNAVFLKHIPTGIFVKCHETRSCDVNRQLARKYLAEKVDVHLHGEESHLRMRQKQLSEQKQIRKMENKRILELKRTFKESLKNDENKE